MPIQTPTTSGAQIRDTEMPKIVRQRASPEEEEVPLAKKPVQVRTEGFLGTFTQHCSYQASTSNGNVSPVDSRGEVAALGACTQCMRVRARICHCLYHWMHTHPRHFDMTCNQGLRDAINRMQRLVAEVDGSSMAMLLDVTHL